MAQPTNTFDAFDAVGNREDLTNMIWNIAPTATPFVSGIGRTPVTNILHEWQSDTLDAASSTNAQIQGDDATGGAITPTVRLNNRTQISEKVITIAGTQIASDPAGRGDELGYQVALKGSALKRDIESAATQNNAAVTGNSTLASRARTLEAWYTTNTSRGTSGANGSTSAAATDGDQRDLTENLLKSVLQDIFVQGGEPDMIMVGGVNKQKISGFSGNNTRMADGEDQKLVTNIDIYTSDFGTMKVIANRFQRERTAHILQTDMWATGFLRPFADTPLAKTGDSEKRLINTEWTLESRNQAASGVIADLSTS
jgi:hypothetical protein